MLSYADECSFNRFMRRCQGRSAVGESVRRQTSAIRDRNVNAILVLPAEHSLVFWNETRNGESWQIRSYQRFMDNLMTSAAYRYSNDDVGTSVHDCARPHVACSWWCSIHKCPNYMNTISELCPNHLTGICLHSLILSSKLQIAASKQPLYSRGTTRS